MLGPEDIRYQSTLPQKLKKPEKKKHFVFFNRSAFLFFQKRHSNIFFTLTDCKKNTIICKTSGIVKVGRLKKAKIAVQALESIIPSLKLYFDFYSIKSLTLVFRNHVPKLYYGVMVHQLNSLGVLIKKIEIKYLLPHNGIRARTPRRV